MFFTQLNSVSSTLDADNHIPEPPEPNIWGIYSRKTLVGQARKGGG